MLKAATKNEDGDLIYTQETKGPSGGNRKQEVNCTAIYSPGRRKTSDVEMLVMEAEMAADGKDLGNPAFPTSGEIAEQVHDRLDDEIEPAWIACDVREFP